MESLDDIPSPPPPPPHRRRRHPASREDNIPPLVPADPPPLVPADSPSLIPDDLPLLVPADPADDLPPLVPADPPLAPPLRAFHTGRVPHISRQEREWRQRHRQRYQARKEKIPAKPVQRIPFPLSLNKSYDFLTSMTLGRFPRSSVQAITHLKVIMAPPLPTCKTPKIFQWTPEQLKTLHDAFYENLNARWAFRRLWVLYLLKKTKSVSEGVDPITLEPIEKRVSIHSLKSRAIYNFEAKSISKTWTTNLLHNDGLFHEPRYPTNPFTNLPITLLQVHNGIKAIRAANQSNWVLESFLDCHCDLDQWKKKFSAPLRAECLKHVFNDEDNYERNETLLDFIELQHDYHGIDFNLNFYRWILASSETKDYVDLWVRECKKYYVEKYATSDKDDLENLEVKTSVSTAYLMEVPSTIRILYRKYLETQHVSRRGVHRRLVIDTATELHG